MTDEFYLALGKQAYWYNETRKFEHQENPDYEAWKAASLKWKEYRVEVEKVRRKLGHKFFYEVKNER